MSYEMFEHHVVYLTARISVELPDNAGTSIGTGFFYKASLKDESNRSLTLLISNKHVFKDARGKLLIGLNRKKEDGSPAFGNVHTFQQNGFSNNYYPHPDEDVDLACINASAISHSDAFYKNLHDEFLRDIQYEKVVPGRGVLFVGYPEGRFDVINNLPLIRNGAIASLPSIDFNGRGQIVIDAQVFQGSSGSPVFVEYDGNYHLLGVITETMIRHSKLQAIPANLPQLGVQQILGLGIVIKQRHVKELIDYTVEEFITRSGTL